MSTFDIAIVGGGIVGLATAHHLTHAHPEQSLVVLEKEPIVAAHQTGRNSGVIHSGIYYKPGSLKAENCRQGKRALVQFCEEEGVAYEMCGKVIVAAEPEEVPRLRAIEARGRKNGVACTRIGPERLREREPHVRGVEALHVPEAGIVDYAGMARRLAARIREGGHEVKTGAGVRAIAQQNGAMYLETEAGAVKARYVVNCAGLYADRIAAMGGAAPDVQVLPFLGVHFTRRVDGRVECGPSAVLAFAREGYGLTDVHWKELLETLTYPGFVRLSLRYWKKGLAELAQSVSTRVYLRALRHLIPEITADDLAPAPSGVRAQAVTRRGDMVDDFLITETDRVVNVLNAASPAATASLNVGRLVGERLAVRF